MDNYQQTERKLCIMDCIWNMLFHWRRVLVSILVFAVLMGVAKYAKDSRAILSEQENGSSNQSNIDAIVEQINELTGTDKADAQVAINLVKSVLSKKDYNTNACAMKLDCYDVDRIVLQYYVKAEKNTSELLQAYSNSWVSAEAINKIVEASDGSMTSDDVVDMITSKNGGINFQTDTENKNIIVNGTENEILYITVRGVDKETAEKTANEVKQIIEDYHVTAEKIYGNHSLIKISENYMDGRDEALVNLQTLSYESAYNMNDKLDTLTSKMSENAAQLVKDYEAALSLDYTDVGNKNSDSVKSEADTETTKPTLSLKWIVLGAILGIMFVGVLEVLYWLIGGKLNSPGELQQNFNIRIYGVVEEHKRRRIFGIIDKCIYRIKNRNNKILSDEQTFRMILSGIILSAKQNNISCIYLTGTDIERYEKKTLFLNLKQECKERGLELRIGQGVTCVPEALSDIADIGNVILVEETGVSKYQEIVREINMIKEQQVNILGSIVINH